MPSLVVIMNRRAVVLVAVAGVGISAILWWRHRKKSPSSLARATTEEEPHRKHFAAFLR